MKILDERGSEMMEGWLEFIRSAIEDAYRGRKRKKFSDFSIREGINVPEMLPLFPRNLTMNMNVFKRRKLEEVEPIGRQMIYYIAHDTVLDV